MKAVDPIDAGRTTDRVQRLQTARRDLQLGAAVARLDKYHLLVLDDLAYVTKDQAETSVLFELISARYERRSLLTTANQPSAEWRRIFPDQAMTRHRRPLRPPRHNLEMNVESYRRRVAIERKRGLDGHPHARQSKPHPNCRAVLTQIVAPYPDTGEDALGPKIPFPYGLRDRHADSRADT